MIIPRHMIWCLTERVEASALTVTGALLSTLVPILTEISRQSSRTNWRVFWLRDSNKNPTTGS
ncbi:protein of unknown function [Hyphomicrobium sp. MC1]|nr:protein of unknown function [Hyphomicrobium sp. MC1]